MPEVEGDRFRFLHLPTGDEPLRTGIVQLGQRAVTIGWFITRATSVQV